MKNSIAANQGISLRELVTVALDENLRGPSNAQKPWMNSFGKLRGLHVQTARIDRLISEEFGALDPEDRL